MLQKSVLRATVLLACVLALAGTAHASVVDTEDRLPFDLYLSLDLSPAAGDPEAQPASNQAPPSPEEVPDDADERAQQVLSQWQRRAQAMLAEIQQQADIDKLQSEVLNQVHDAQEQLGHTGDEVRSMVPLDDEPESEEATPGDGAPITPQAEATSAWEGIQAPMMLMAGTAVGFGFLAWLIGQSATVGAGAAGTAAAKGRRFVPFASPLFTRFEKDTVLGHPKREAIYGQIVEKPGVTLQDLCQTTGLSRTAVTHHLRLMEQQHLVVSKRVGRSRHFFENGGRYGRDQKEAYAVLHNDRSKDIHGFIQKNPGSIQKDLCAAFGIQASVAHWHVKRLVEANLVEAIRQGRTVSYFPSADISPAGYA